jgi:hypothetical protein
MTVIGRLGHILLVLNFLLMVVLDKLKKKLFHFILSINYTL